MRMTLVALGCVLAGSTAVAQEAATAAAANQMVRTAQIKWMLCMRTIDEKLQAARVTPERYQMAVMGACQSEDGPLRLAMRVSYTATLIDARLPAVVMDKMQAEIAERSERYPTLLREKFVSDYVVWYAANGQSPPESHSTGSTTGPGR